MSAARILIVDPHPITREGIRQILAADPARWEVCGSESNAIQAIAQAVRLQPDLAIVEYEGHGMDCLELAAELRKVRRSLRVMLYTQVTKPYLLLRMFHASGLAGYVLKSEPIPELALGLQIIQEQRQFRSREATQLCQQAAEEWPGFVPLTPSELEILQLTSQGKSGKEIADIRGVSLATVETQQRSIRCKLRVPCACGAVGVALRHGIIR